MDIRECLQSTHRFGVINTCCIFAIAVAARFIAHKLFSAAIALTSRSNIHRHTKVIFLFNNDVHRNFGTGWKRFALLLRLGIRRLGMVRTVRFNAIHRAWQMKYTRCGRCRIGFFDFDSLCCMRPRCTTLPYVRRPELSEIKKMICLQESA